VRILELPFVERPVLELLHFDDGRVEVDRTYAGYGWARVPRLMVGGKLVEDALVLALHSADDGEALADDIELEFELPGRDPVAVLASQFLGQWLPQLPEASAIVLAMCNPHEATLGRPPAARVPIYYATGDVESWLDEHGGVELTASGSWTKLSP
jgi:hypothetical protein